MDWFFVFDHKQEEYNSIFKSVGRFATRLGFAKPRAPQPDFSSTQNAIAFWWEK
jgi:hypothetical protein